MGTAYTPGLKVSAGTTVRKTRRLPIKGEVLVRAGDRVRADDVVARTTIPGIIHTIRAAEMLGLEPSEAAAALKVAQGDHVEAGQLIAESRSFFGLIRSECRSPVTGTVELISPATGHVGIRLTPAPVEVTAYVDGTVCEILPDEGVVIETFGAFIQGIFGVGGERTGILRLPGDSPDCDIAEDLITEAHAGAVLVGGAGVTMGALRKAASVGVCGVVVGAIVDTDLTGYLGHDIGVAITGHEDIPATVIVTEGFGPIKMARRTFELLKSLEGKKVSINGATQIRAGVIRPEIIAPLEPAVETLPAQRESQILDIGSSIRIIREPLFGRLGTVVGLPQDPVRIESGAVVRVLEAELADGGRAVVPRANVEIIEE